jgi:hypothetical protein
MKMCKLNNPFPQVESTVNTSVKKKPELGNASSQTTANKVVPKVKTVSKTTAVENKVKEEKSKEDPKQIEKEKLSPQISKVEESAPVKLKRSSRSRGISIKQGMTSVKAEEKKINLEDELNVKFDKVDKEISKEEFLTAVDVYTKKIKKEKPAFASALERKNIEIHANNTIHINVVNHAMDDKELKYDFLLFLKKELDNKQIQLTTKVIEAEKKQSVTSMDIYNNMKKKNPNLETIRKQLDLDFMA